MSVSVYVFTVFYINTVNVDLIPVGFALMHMLTKPYVVSCMANLQMIHIFQANTERQNIYKCLTRKIFEHNNIATEKQILFESN